MTRRIVAAMVGWGLLVALWAVFVGGGHVPMCLGPLDVTPESCRAAMGLAPETAWDQFANGPGLLVVMLVGGWLAIGLVAVGMKRQRGGL